ncbi:hypothetical protein [Pseudomonas asplenii]|uniref:hypothetical protein n=1 Tax=Pseudomonas asplenii TaxID=53407 RepID=UPI0006B4358D|nr:hypothetical protein [Pseudomonas fuscovaginae]
MWWDDIWKWVVGNNGVLAFLLALAVAGSALYHYISIKRAEERARRFSNFHQLIQDMNGDASGAAPYIDRQIAIIFELRNFPEYFPVTERILDRARKRWIFKNFGNGGAYDGVIKEAGKTLSLIARRQDCKHYLSIEEEDRKVFSGTP